MYYLDPNYGTVAPTDLMNTSGATAMDASSAYHDPNTVPYPSSQMLPPAPPPAEPSSSRSRSSRTSSSKQTQPIQCPDCIKTFPGKRDLNRHIKTHDLPLGCEADRVNCMVRKAEQRDMDRHYRSSHKEYAQTQGIPLEDIECYYCLKKFTRNDNYLRHLRNKHGIDTSQTQGQQ